MSASSKPVRLTAMVVKTFAANNHLPAKELAGLISSVQRTFASIEAGPSASAPPAALIPAVPIKKSVTPDYLICLEDGQKFRTLKRHLSKTYGMTLAEYRAKWRLPADYPAVAPNYSARRREAALASGLGATKARSAKAKKAR